MPEASPTDAEHAGLLAAAIKEANELIDDARAEIALNEQRIRDAEAAVRAVRALRLDPASVAEPATDSAATAAEVPAEVSLELPLPPELLPADPASESAPAVEPATDQTADTPPQALTQATASEIPAATSAAGEVPPAV